MSGGMNLAVTMPAPVKSGEISRSAASPVTAIGTTKSPPRGKAIIGITAAGGSVDDLTSVAIDPERDQQLGSPQKTELVIKPPEIQEQTSSSPASSPLGEPAAVETRVTPLKSITRFVVRAIAAVRKIVGESRTETSTLKGRTQPLVSDTTVEGAATVLPVLSSEGYHDRVGKFVLRGTEIIPAKEMEAVQGMKINIDVLDNNEQNIVRMLSETLKIVRDWDLPHRVVRNIIEMRAQLGTQRGKTITIYLVRQGDDGELKFLTGQQIAELLTLLDNALVPISQKSVNSFAGRSGENPWGTSGRIGWRIESYNDELLYNLDGSEKAGDLTLEQIVPDSIVGAQFVSPDATWERSPAPPTGSGVVKKSNRQLLLTNIFDGYRTKQLTTSPEEFAGVLQEALSNKFLGSKITVTPHSERTERNAHLYIVRVNGKPWLIKFISVPEHSKVNVAEIWAKEWAISKIMRESPFSSRFLVNNPVDFLKDAGQTEAARELEKSDWDGLKRAMEGYFIVEGALFTVTRFIEDSKNWSKARLSRRVRTRLLAELTYLVDALREHGIIHGDIKPGNVVVGGKESLFGHRKIFLIDFETAVLFAGNEQLTWYLPWKTPFYTTPWHFSDLTSVLRPSEHKKWLEFLDKFAVEILTAEIKNNVTFIKLRQYDWDRFHQNPIVGANFAQLIRDPHPLIQEYLAYYRKASSPVAVKSEPKPSTSSPLGEPEKPQVAASPVEEKTPVATLTQALKAAEMSDYYIEKIISNLSQASDPQAVASAFISLLQALQAAGVDGYDILFIVSNLSQASDPQAVASAFISLLQALQAAGGSRYAIAPILDGLSQASDPQAATIKLKAAVSAFISLAQALKAAGVSGDHNHNLLFHLSQTADPQTAKIIVQNLQDFIDLFRSYNFFTDLFILIKRFISAYPEIAIQDLARVLSLDEYILGDYDYPRSSDNISEEMLSRYAAEPKLVRIRAMLAREELEELKRFIQAEQIQPSQLWQAVLLNHQNQIISQTTDLIQELAGRKGVLKGMISLTSKIGGTEFAKENLEFVLVQLGISLSEQKLREMGFKFYSHKGKVLVIPLVFDCLLSAYRGSAEYDHAEASYLTHALTTAIVHYANIRGEARGDEQASPFGANAFHELDLGLMMLEGRNNRRVDESVSLAFFYGGPLLEYVRKRTIATKRNTVVGLIEELMQWQLKERRAKQNIHKIFTWIIQGTLNPEQLGQAIERLKEEVDILRSQSGLKDAYFEAVFGFLDEAFYNQIKQGYNQTQDNRNMLQDVLKQAIERHPSVVNTPARNGNPEKRASHPWIDRGKNLLDYLENETEIRRGTFDDVDLSTVDLQSLTGGLIRSSVEAAQSGKEPASSPLGESEKLQGVASPVAQTPLPAEGIIWSILKRLLNYQRGKLITMKVYHATRRGPELSVSNRYTGGFNGIGVFFVEDEEWAKELFRYQGNDSQVYEFTIEYRRPKVFKDKKDAVNSYLMFEADQLKKDRRLSSKIIADRYRASLLEAGFDSIIFNEELEGRFSRVIVALKDNQFKRVGNKGYDISDKPANGSSNDSAASPLAGQQGSSTSSSLGAQDEAQEGLCVTGDTLLPVLSEDRGQKTKDRRYILKPIVKVKPGDYVLSFNEETQAIEPHRIKGLLDMGVKPVFKLTTASGRSIKTTANHPYLTNKGWVKVSRLKVGDEIGAPKEINGRVLHLVSADGHKLQREFQQLQQLNPLSILPCLTSIFRIEPKTYQHRNDKKQTTPYPYKNRKIFKEITCQSHCKSSLCQIAYKFTNVFLAFILNLAHQFKNNIINGVCQLKNYFISPEEALAQPALESTIFWDRVISIEPIGSERVYDIEVEGTHNFIGNGIFAHNTYMGDKSPGASSPLAELDERDASSPVNEPAFSDKGGVDFRGLPIVTQPAGSLPLGTVPTSFRDRPLRTNSQETFRGQSLDLDAEWRQIENMAQAGLIPSNERIREYLQASCQSQDCSQRIDKVLSLFADILRLEEERVSSTEPALREILVLLESDKPAPELQIALSKIEVLPQEPQLIEQ